MIGMKSPSGPSGRRDVRARKARPRRLHLESMEDRTLMAWGFLTGPNPGQPLDIVKDYLARNGQDYGVAPADLSTLQVTDAYTDPSGSQTTYLYLRQTFDGLPVYGTELNAAVTPRGEIITIGGSFVAGLADKATGQPPTPALSAADALLAVAADLGIQVNDPTINILQNDGGLDQSMIISAPGISTQPVPAKLAYHTAADGSAELTWDFVINVAEPRFQVYNAYADATTGALVSSGEWVDYLNDGTYNVYGLPNASPNYGPRRLATNNYDPAASPFGWLDTDGVAGADSTQTQGNNVDAFVDVNASYSDPASATPSQPRPDGGASLNFNFPINFTAAPLTYADATTTNLFFVTNTAHDLFFKYGFTEAAGNFQQMNYTGQGQAGDRLKAIEAFGYNNGYTDNAFMYTPPDGSSPVIAMFLWDLTGPYRSGSLDGEVIAHEFTHGVTNRLTGGPSNANALNAVQSGSMGEGWSDYFSMMFSQGGAAPTRSTIRPTGTYVLGEGPGGGGIRRYPYSYDMSVNPLTLNRYNGGFPNNEVHNAGEIWCQVLWDMTVLLVEKHGYNPSLKDGYSGPDSAGNILAMQLVMDALKLQPSNPSFLQARDAILQADQALTGGENQEEIWTAFARRGFGLSASSGASSSSTTVNQATDLPAFPQVTVASPSGLMENQAYTDLKVASFTDSANLAASSYTVTVSLSDGTPVTPTVVSAGSGQYDVVIPSKTFQEGGTYSVKVRVQKPGLGPIARTGSIQVGDLPINAQAAGLPSGLSEGDPFSGVVATFYDTDPDLLAPGVYAATIFWGDDGSQTPGVIVADPTAGPNHFKVTGDHVFSGGDSTVSILVTGPGGGTARVDNQVSVVDSDINSAGRNATAQEGTPFPSVPIAWFADTDPRITTASQYSAQINWGDGTAPTTGRVEPNYGPEGGFLVFGDHAYEVRTSPYTATVTIRQTNNGPKTAESTSQISVYDSPLDGSSRSFNATEGVAFDRILAAFTDSDPRINPTSRYVVDVNWEDGRQSSTATDPTLRVAINTDGGFLVYGNYAYATPGVYDFKIRIADGVGGSFIERDGTITVPEAPLVARLEPTASPTEGQPFNGAVASFTTPNPMAQPGDFQATITWGDGTVTTDAPITYDAAGKRFYIRGDKAYETAGSYPVSVLVGRPNGRQSQAAGLINVTDAPLDTSSRAIQQASKTALTGLLVGSFADTNPFGDGQGFTASIDWGDGNTEPGQVVPNNSGGFDVLGDHTFARSGNYNVRVTVASPGGGSSTIVSAAAISPRIFALTGAVAGANPSMANSSTPTFTGQAEPGATVRLYAVPQGATNLISIATTTAGGDGGWTATATSLGDGLYTLVAAANDTNGDISTPALMLLPAAARGPLVIDTQGPKVQNVNVNPRTGQVQVTLADAGTGLASAGLLNSANFGLLVNSGRATRTLRVSNLTVTPASPGSVQTATLTFAGLNRFNRGSYVLQISAPGVSDLAGNPLDERYYIPFPGLYNRPGQNFIAQFTSNGQATSPLAQYIPPQEITAADRFRQRILARRFPGRVR